MMQPLWALQLVNTLSSPLCLSRHGLFKSESSIGAHRHVSVASHVAAR